MIPAQAVEAAAKALADELQSEYLPEAWMDIATAALEAAAPYVLAGAWDEGHSAGVDHADGLDGGSNPYDRPTP